MIGDYAISYREAKACTASVALGGKEGLEYPVDIPWVNSNARILNGSCHPFSTVFRTRLRFNLQVTSRWHGLERVVHQVQKNLFHLVTVN